MGVDGRAALTEGNPPEAGRIAHFSVDQVLPKQHAFGFGRACAVHPGGHFSHGSGVDTRAPKDC